MKVSRCEQVGRRFCALLSGGPIDILAQDGKGNKRGVRRGKEGVSK